MLFRYKVCKKKQRKYHLIKIQKYKPDASVFSWREFDTISLQYLLTYLNQTRFCRGEDISEPDIYCELQRYNNMNDIVIKYIQERIEDEKICECISREERKFGEYIDRFVLTNGWTSLEIKEKETQNED